MLRTIRFASAFALLALAACNTTSESGAGSDGPLFLPTGEPDNTSAPTIEVDATGRIHAVYPAYAGGRAYYATCRGACDATDDYQVVRFDTDGTVDDAMLALDANGRPHVLLSTFSSVYYATCAGDCADPSSWTTTRIVKHDGKRDVSGEAFALDANGHPRFLMHTYVAYLGIGQDTPETDWVACDDDCGNPASWSVSKISDQIWRSSTLRFDATGRALVSTSAMPVNEDGSLGGDIGAFAECDADCGADASWRAVGLANAYTSDTEAVSISPAISMAVTADGAPRIVMLRKNDEGGREIVYFACDAADCSADGSWAGTILSSGDDLGAGVDIALDADDHPRFVYTFSYAIGLAHCNDAHCETADAHWDLTKVEAGSEMSPDDIFLYPNCNVAAWFLHSPSIALTKDGAPRVGYQARDISGGWTNPDPNEPDCVAGTDMTWSRIALLSSI